MCDGEDRRGARLLTCIVTDGDTMVAAHGGKELFVSTYKTRCADRDTCPSLSAECEAPTRTGFVNHLIFSSEPLRGENVWQELEEGDVLGVDWRMRVLKTRLDRHGSAGGFGREHGLALSGPRPRGATARKALLEALRAGPRTARELSAEVSLPEREVVAHLEHLGALARPRRARAPHRAAALLRAAASVSRSATGSAVRAAVRAVAASGSTCRASGSKRAELRAAAI